MVGTPFPLNTIPLRSNNFPIYIISVFRQIINKNRLSSIFFWNIIYAANQEGWQTDSMEKIFRLKENGTTAATEVIAGITTFMAMAYIIAVNPNLLTNFDVGSPLWNSVFLATCISSAIGTLCMAFLANKPFCMAPSMGLNAFFVVVVTNIAAVTGLTYLESFRSALCIIFIEGILFLILSLINLREKIVDAIPLGIRIGISPAIGLMLMNIGFGSNVGVYDGSGNVYYVMADFFGSISPSFIKDRMGDSYPLMVLTVVTIFTGLFTIIILSHRNIKGAILIGILTASAVHWICSFLFLKTNPFEALSGASFVPAFSDMVDTTLFKLNFSGLVRMGWFVMITLIITFCIIDLFDTIGSLVGAAQSGGIMDDKGNMPNMKEALVSDAVATIAGSLTGTSTVTTFAESSSGVEAGGRTGLTALTAGILFLLSAFLAPVVAIIPAAATSSALIYVGFLMLKMLKKLDFDDSSQAFPVFIMLLAMPISGSIGHGIGLALITYTFIKVFTGKAKDVSALTYVLSAIFLLKFFVSA